MKLNEQELSWDEVEVIVNKTASTSPKAQTGNTSPTGGRGNEDPTSKNDPPKDDIPKDDLPLKGNANGEPANLKTIHSGFVSNFDRALKFFYQAGPATQNGDTDKLYELLTILRKPSGDKGDQKQRAIAMYIDWVIRLSNPASNPGKLAQKYRKQYDYVLTRNGKSSNTVQTIQSVPKSPALLDLNSFFDPQNPIGQDLGFVEDQRLRRSVLGFVEFRDGNTKSQLVKNIRRDAYVMHKDIMNFYKWQKEGVPKAKYKTKF